MNGHTYTVEFRIYSSNIDPSEITKELGLQPCQTRMANTTAVRKSSKNMWAYDGGEGSQEWDSLEEGITCVLDKLWIHRGTIGKYKPDADLVWWCGNFQSSFDGGPRLSPELLKRLGEFGASLFIDCYFSSNEDKEEGHG